MKSKESEARRPNDPFTSPQESEGRVHVGTHEGGDPFSVLSVGPLRKLLPREDGPGTYTLVGGPRRSERMTYFVIHYKENSGSALVCRRKDPD